MKADETEREIKVAIVDDEGWEPDEDFYVRLLDIADQERLEGDDTECTVTILDEDKPGNIGFVERQIEVNRKDKVAYVLIQRKDGTDGNATCILNTMNDVDSVPGKKAAKANVDFEPIIM